MTTSPGPPPQAGSEPADLHPAGIRQLGHDDLAAFRDHLLRLDRESRLGRFAMPASDAFVTRYATTAFIHDSTLFGHFDGPVLRAAAELRPVSRRAAEAAFTVEPAYRGRGVATALFARIIEDARARGTSKIYMSCLSHNRAMQALARKFEAEFVFEPADLLQAHEQSTRHEPSSEDTVKQDEFATAIVRLGGGWRRFQARRS